MPCCPGPAVFCYLLSALLDAFDGHAARALNQGTKFGAMLDMLTDRCATMCLLVNLALLYPSYTFLFQLSMCLDVASHWLHLHRCVQNILYPIDCLWLQCLLGVCGVVCVLKSGISLLHLITASRNMAAIDVADRERERSKAQ
uniref:CDP-diacylglycerol--inositol 3-phosphatidyltransferase (phosphatidylinositol synthase) n=1 Tax=Cyprinus carpio TaxID=7962 RepID=A0A8C2CTY6_CYPCA